MKNYLWLFILLSLPVQSKTYQFLEQKGLSSSPVKKLIEDNEVKVQFHIPSLETIDDKSYSLIQGDFSYLKVEGLENKTEVSKASLPYYSFLVRGKPEGLSFHIKRGEGHFLEGVTPRPSKELPCRCLRDKEVDPNIDLEVFEKGDGLYRVEYLGDYRGVPLTKITVSPALYKNSELRIYPNLELRVSQREKNNEPLSFSLNSLLEESSKSFIIVSADHLIEGSSKIADYKRSQGFDVKLISLDDIGKTSSELKSFLHREYKERRYDYALLIGHEDTLPTEYVDTTSDAETPSDLKFFTMGGRDDLIPDVFYGRIVAEKNEEVLSQLKKIKEYDSRDYSDGSGKNHFVGIASNEGYDPTDVEYMEGFASELKKGFSIETSFFFQDDSSSYAANINKALRKGASWLSYIGHGSGDSWSSVGRGDYNSSHIKDLKAGIVKPIIIDVACQNGRFSYEGRLGERFMNEKKDGEPIGAVAYYGGSVDISWHPPAVMAKGINRSIASQGVRVLGEALLRGQLFLLESFDDRAAAEENLVWYHLFGDPSMQIHFD